MCVAISCCQTHTNPETLLNYRNLLCVPSCSHLSDSEQSLMSLDSFKFMWLLYSRSQASAAIKGNNFIIHQNWIINYCCGSSWWRWRRPTGMCPSHIALGTYHQRNLTFYKTQIANHISGSCDENVGYCVTFYIKREDRGTNGQIDERTKGAGPEIINNRIGMGSAATGYYCVCSRGCL